MVYIGADACKAGWLAVSFERETIWDVSIFPDIAGLCDRYKGVALILIDIPIGLPDTGSKERCCDTGARRLLGPKRGSSVFPVPCRSAVYADITKASDINEKLTGRRLSRQALGITAKIRQVDQLLLAQKAAKLVIKETHPEVCFWALNNRKPIESSKRKEQGFLERRKILRRVYPYTQALLDHALQKFPRSKVARDDVLDALVAAITASKGRQGLLSIPERPEVDSKGLPMEIVYCPVSRNLSSV